MTGILFALIAASGWGSSAVFTKIALEKIDNYIVNHFEKYNFYDYYAIFQQLNLLRIVPYTKKPSIIAFLNNELAKNIDYS